MWGYQLANTLSVTLSHAFSSVIFLFHIGIESINSGRDIFGSPVTTFKWVGFGRLSVIDTSQNKFFISRLCAQMRALGNLGEIV